MKRRFFTTLLTVACLFGCQDAAEPHLDRCINLEKRSEWKEAIDACGAAVRASSASDAGILADGKLGVLREKLAAKRAWDQAQRDLHARQLEQETEARRIAVGGWKYLPRPADDNASRMKYMTDVANAFEGEPPLDRIKATQIMEKVRVALAKAAGVPVSTVTARVRTTSGSIKVADGVTARIGNTEEDAIEVGVCSEAFLGTALLGVESDALDKAGLRGLLCNSTACSATFDLRPDRPHGGGLYGGAACIRLAEVMVKAMHR
jgi:hypothetical protein